MKISGQVQIIGVTPSREQGNFRLSLHDYEQAHQMLPTGSKRAKLGGLNCPVIATAEQVKGLSFGDDVEIEGSMQLVEGGGRPDERGERGKTYENVRIFVNSIRPITKTV